MSWYGRDIDDRAYLLRAIELARSGMERGQGGPFGAVVVQRDAVLGEGENRVVATNDPTAHAEVVAIRNACAKVGRFSLQGATLYASSEPCPMCLAAAYWSRLDRIVFANDRAVASRAGFDDSFFYDELARPISERRTPLAQVSVSGAERLFDEWTSKADRVRY
ncbi:MAG TPA: nucleoside deaminase [Polyangiaceae bacterium]|nr:nucleoside deaminase [Polyangiaceae bacterium]